MWGRRSVNPQPKRLARLTFEKKPRNKKGKNQKTKMLYTGHRNFQERTNKQPEVCESSHHSPEKEEENPFFHMPRIDEEPQCELTHIEDDDEHEQMMHWDMIIKKMAETTDGNSAILAKTLKMQPDDILAKLGISKDLISSPSKECNEQRPDRWREERSNQNTPPKYNPPFRKNLEAQFTTSHNNPLYENKRDGNQNNNFNRQNNQRQWNNGSQNRKIQQNCGNTRQPYGLNQNNNNQNIQGYMMQNPGNRNQVIRQPMAIER